MTNRYTFDMAYLRILADQRSSAEELTSELGISNNRLESILSGREEFKCSEMLALARILCLTQAEFVRCFFMAESSEKLN